MSLLGRPTVEPVVSGRQTEDSNHFLGWERRRSCGSTSISGGGITEQGGDITQSAPSPAGEGWFLEARNDDPLMAAPWNLWGYAVCVRCHELRHSHRQQRAGAGLEPVRRRPLRLPAHHERRHHAFPRSKRGGDGHVPAGNPSSRRRLHRRPHGPGDERAPGRRRHRLGRGGHQRVEHTDGGHPSQGGLRSHDAMIVDFERNIFTEVGLAVVVRLYRPSTVAGPLLDRPVGGSAP